MIESEEDRAIFTDPRDFGEVVTVKPNGGDPFDIPVLWDARPKTEGVAGGYTGGAKVSGAGICIECPTSLVRGLVAHRDQVQRKPENGGALYDIQENKPDGRGMSLVRLMEA